MNKNGKIPNKLGNEFLNNYRYKTSTQWIIWNMSKTLEKTIPWEHRNMSHEIPWRFFPVRYVTLPEGKYIQYNHHKKNIPIISHNIPMISHNHNNIIIYPLFPIHFLMIFPFSWYIIIIYLWHPRIFR